MIRFLPTLIAVITISSPAVLAAATTSAVTDSDVVLERAIDYLNSNRAAVVVEHKHNYKSPSARLVKLQRRESSRIMIMGDTNVSM